MKIQEFTSALKNKNIKFVFRALDHGIIQIGINPRSFIWDWYEFNPRFNDIDFLQTYSQNNGKTKAGLLYGIDRKNKLGKKIGFNFNF